MIRNRFGFAMAALLLVFAAPAFAQDADKAAAVDALLTPATPGSPGIAVAIYHAGKVEYVQGYGLANLEQGTPVTPRTRFNVASVSKEFTALAIAMLAEEGKVDLSADVRRYLPWLPDFGKTITVADLVHHLSGLKDSNILFWFAERESADHLTQARLIAILKRQRGLLFDPGTRFSYTNTGYVLLAEVVRAASGKSLRQFEEERIFRPLGMVDSLVRDDASEIVPRRAQAYAPTPGGGWRITLNNADNFGATNVNTTAADMARWFSFLDGKAALGGPDLLKTVTTPSKLRDGTAVNYAFGLYAGRSAGRDTIGHSGSVSGYRALVTWLPKERFGVVLMANGSQDLGVPADRIVELYLGKAPPDPNRTDDMPGPIAATPAMVKAAAGHYVSDHLWSADLVAEEGKLYWVSALSTILPKSELILRGDDFFSRGTGLAARYFRFDRDAKGAITGFRKLSELGTKDFVADFRRQPPVHPTPAELAPLAGDYHVPELDITYSFRLDGDHLVASSMWSNRPITLVPVAANRFDTDSIPLGSIAVDRDAAGKPVGFTIVGGGLIGTRLERRGPVE